MYRCERALKRRGLCYLANRYAFSEASKRTYAKEKVSEGHYRFTWQTRALLGRQVLGIRSTT
jgi:hypothetical protein